MNHDQIIIDKVSEEYPSWDDRAKYASYLTTKKLSHRDAISIASGCDIISLLKEGIKTCCPYISIWDDCASVALGGVLLPTALPRNSQFIKEENLLFDFVYGHLLLTEDDDVRSLASLFDIERHRIRCLRFFNSVRKEDIHGLQMDPVTVATVARNGLHSEEFILAFFQIPKESEDKMRTVAKSQGVDWLVSLNHMYNEFVLIPEEEYM